MKIKKKFFGVWGGGEGVRMDVNEELKFLGKLKKKNGGGGVRLGGGQDGCERRIEVFVKIKKKLELMFMKHYAPNRCCLKISG